MELSPKREALILGTRDAKDFEQEGIIESPPKVDGDEDEKFEDALDHSVPGSE